MLSINMDDVMNVINSIKSYLVAAGVILVAGLLLLILAGMISKKHAGKIRGVAGIGLLAGLAVVVNMICTGPMSTMLDLISGSGTITEATSEEAQELAVSIGEEGIVLLNNDDDLLPLASGSKLNVFGWASTKPILGGAGSGALNDAYPTTDILTSLADAGFETNTELTSFYTEYQPERPVVGMWAQDWTLPEPNVSKYSDDLIANAKAFSDTAMIVISRSGGEGADLPADMTAVVDGSYQDGTTYTAGVYDDSMNEGNDWDEGDHYLKLSNREEEMIDLVCKNFEKVVLVYIKSVLWTAGQGHIGMKALGKLLNGEVNPSGKMIDTYVYDLKATPWWNNFGDFNYTNMDDFAYTSVGFTGTESTATPGFVNYVEGIYVGYKFYETAAAEGFIDYDKVVQYPFGYGLSYTTFEQKMGDITEADGKISFEVEVKNTGDVAGKDVVEVYYNPPYTNGGIEKASANLIAFEKTSLLEPGAS